MTLRLAGHGSGGDRARDTVALRHELDLGVGQLADSTVERAVLQQEAGRAVGGVARANGRRLSREDVDVELDLGVVQREQNGVNGRSVEVLLHRDLEHVVLEAVLVLAATAGKVGGVDVVLGQGHGDCRDVRGQVHAVYLDVAVAQNKLLRH